MATETTRDLSGKIIGALKSQDLVEIKPSTLKSIIEGRFMSLFTIDTNKGPANIQVRTQQSTVQISLNTSDTHLALSVE